MTDRAYLRIIVTTPTIRTTFNLIHDAYLKRTILLKVPSGLGGLVVSAPDFEAEYCGFESRSGRDNFQTISTPSSYSTCPGLSIKWTGRRLVTDSGTKCAWVIHESKAVQIHVHHSNRRCLYVHRVPGSLKNPQQQQQKVPNVNFSNFLEWFCSETYAFVHKRNPSGSSPSFICFVFGGREPFRAYIYTETARTISFWFDRNVPSVVINERLLKKV